MVWRCSFKFLVPASCFTHHRRTTGRMCLSGREKGSILSSESIIVCPRWRFAALLRRVLTTTRKTTNLISACFKDQHYNKKYLASLNPLMHLSHNLKVTKGWTLPRIGGAIWSGILVNTAGTNGWPRSSGNERGWHTTCSFTRENSRQVCLDSWKHMRSDTVSLNDPLCVFPHYRVQSPCPALWLPGVVTDSSRYLGRVCIVSVSPLSCIFEEFTLCDWRPGIERRFSSDLERLSATGKSG